MALKDAEGKAKSAANNAASEEAHETELAKLKAGTRTDPPWSA